MLQDVWDHDLVVASGLDLIDDIVFKVGLSVGLSDIVLSRESSPILLMLYDKIFMRQMRGGDPRFFV